MRSRRDPPRHRAVIVAGTTYHEDDTGRRVTFDSRAGGATGRTASTSAAWPSECCCRCSSSSSGHEWVVEVGPRPACGGLAGDLWLVRRLVRFLRLFAPPENSIASRGSVCSDLAKYYNLQIATVTSTCPHLSRARSKKTLLSLHTRRAQKSVQGEERGSGGRPRQGHRRLRAEARAGRGAGRKGRGHHQGAPGEALPGLRRGGQGVRGVGQALGGLGRERLRSDQADPGARGVARGVARGRTGRRQEGRVARRPQLDGPAPE